MDLASLPKYQQFRPPGRTVRSAGARFRLSPRLTRALLDVTVLLAIAALLYFFWLTGAAAERALTPVPPPPVLDFKLVQQRYDDVAVTNQFEDARKGRFVRREQFHRLLESPSHPNAWGPELSKYWEDLSLPERIWDEWVDPNDPDKRVVILFSEGKVYLKDKQGF